MKITDKIQKSKHLTKIVLCIWFCMIAYLICSMCRSNPFSKLVPATDSSVFIYIGQRMKDGELPYKDCFDHKGPILYIINWLGANLNGIYGIEFLTVFFTIGLTHKIVKKVFHVSNLEAIILNFLVNINIIFFLEGGNLTELYALPCITGALYLILTQNKENFKKKNCGIGLLLGIVLGLRVNMIPLWIIYYMMVLVSCLKRKKFQEIFFIIVYNAYGLLSVLGILGLYLIISGNLKECIQCYLLFNFLYAVSSQEEMKKVFDYFLTWSNQRMYVILILFLIPTRKGKHKLFSVLFTLMTWFIVFQPRNRYLHYALITVPTLILPLTNGYEYIKLKMKSLILRRIAMFIIMLILLVSPLQKYKMDAEVINVKGYRESEKDEVKKYIVENSSEEDKILVIGNDCELYLATNRNAASKYEYQKPIYKMDPSIIPQTIEDIKKNQPKLMIVSKEKSDDQLNQEIQVQILTEYSIVKEGEKFEVYELIE